MAKVHQVFENEKKLGEVRTRGERVYVRCFIEHGNPTWEAESIDEGVEQLLALGDLYETIQVPC